MANKTTSTNNMEDSGYSILSQDQQQPTVQMPRSNSAIMQDSGICSDLLNRLSLNCDEVEPSKYYEPDEDGDVQLHLAVFAGLADVVDALVRMAPSPDHLSVQNNQGYTPLHIAVLQNQPVFVQRLVSAGAQVDLRDGEGNTPLHLSAYRGYVECAQALTISSKSILDQRNNLGQHCVHLATMGGHVPFLQFLNWNGADMNALEGRSGRSSLHLAVGARSLPLVTCLVEPKPSGCGVDASLLDWYGRTPYQLSLMNGQSEIAAFLRSRTPGADSWTNEPTASDSEEEFLAQTAARLVNV